MQTFLPYSSFDLSAQSLDYKRLGKQRVEAKQIHNIVSGARTTGGWRRHPAVLMWMGHAGALALYHDFMIDEWVARGYKNTMPHLWTGEDDFDMPAWLGDERVHESHRSNLLRKDPDHYGKYEWAEADDLPYFWPTEGCYA